MGEAEVGGCTRSAESSPESLRHPISCKKRTLTTDSPPIRRWYQRNVAALPQASFGEWVSETRKPFVHDLFFAAPFPSGANSRVFLSGPVIRQCCDKLDGRLQHAHSNPRLAEVKRRSALTNIHERVVFILDLIKQRLNTCLIDPRRQVRGGAFSRPSD
jgi:hypothetical protein